jgi:hypothetical protein
MEAASKHDILTTLQDYLLDEDWTTRLNNHFLHAVDSLHKDNNEQEEKCHQLYDNFLTYTKLFEERLLDFCTDHSEFGTNSTELLTNLTVLKEDENLQRLLSWTDFDHYLKKVDDMSKNVQLGQEAADLLGL